ncbi:MAG: glycosyltransferase family 1 protein [Leptolyngbya sp. SIO1D8]|nr:glycosyltransferase family 1 protein [Leptolyngbya sp. SIO1D8]
MHITLLTIGSRGDVQPFVPLGIGLQQAGHQVQIATYVDFQPLINRYGLNFFPISGNAQATMLEEAGKKVLDAGGNPFTFMHRYAALLEPLAKQVLADSWAACQGTDAIIAHGIAF